MEKFNFYDFIAILIPGIFFLWCITVIGSVIDLPFNIPIDGDLTQTTLLIVLGYVMGLMLQGISQGITEKFLKFIWGGFPSEKWLLDNNERFSVEYKNKLWKKVEDKLGRTKPYLGTEDDKKIPNKELRNINQEIFYLIYRYIEKEGTTDKHLVFNAQYGLFRCLLTTFLIILLFSLFVIICRNSAIDNLNFYLVGISLFGSIISYFRVKKRGEDFAKCILDSFLIS